MTFVQGKYFVMALHLISSYSKKHPEIIKEIVKDTILIKVLRSVIDIQRRPKCDLKYLISDAAK